MLSKKVSEQTIDVSTMVDPHDKNPHGVVLNLGDYAPIAHAVAPKLPHLGAPERCA